MFFFLKWCPRRSSCHLLIACMCLNPQFQASCEYCVIPHVSMADTHASLLKCGLAILYTRLSGEILPATVVGISEPGPDFIKITYKPCGEEVSPKFQEC